MDSTNDLEKIVKKLRGFVTNNAQVPANYIRNLVCTKLPYLELFVENKPFPPFEVEIQISSSCNLECRWCIGAEVQQKRNVLRLKDDLNIGNIDNIINDIVEFRQNGLGIELVKFSGFIGEPLLRKEVTLHAIKLLVGSGFKVGLFTNGVFMTEDTWQTLANILYVNLSLDAGPISYFWMKESRKEYRKEFFVDLYNENNFPKVLANISGLRQKRDEMKTKLNITVSYVVVPGNHREIFETACLVKKAGADGIRFKCDIGGKLPLSNPAILKEAFDQLARVKEECETPEFAVTIIHSEEDVNNKTYRDWKCMYGCFYQLFVATIGSNGEVYMCDHNTIPGAISFGNAANDNFQKIWESKRRQFLIGVDAIPIICQCDVCPPFGNATNFFLRDLRELADKHGAAMVNKALHILKTDLEVAVK